MTMLFISPHSFDLRIYLVLLQETYPGTLTALPRLETKTRGVVGGGQRRTASTHFFVRKDSLCTFYIHFWPCRHLASTQFLWRPPNYYGVHKLLFLGYNSGSHSVPLPVQTRQKRRLYVSPQSICRILC